MVKSEITLLVVMVMIALSNGIRVENMRHTQLDMEKEEENLDAHISFTTFGFPVAVLVNGISIPFNTTNENYSIEIYPEKPYPEEYDKERPYPEEYDQEKPYPEEYDKERPYPEPYEQSEYNQRESYDDDDQKQISDSVLDQEEANAANIVEIGEEIFEFPIISAYSKVKPGDLISIVFQNNAAEQQGIIGNIILVDNVAGSVQTIITDKFTWKCNYYEPNSIASNKGETFQKIYSYPDDAMWIDLPISTHDENIICTTMIS